MAKWSRAAKSKRNKRLWAEGRRERWASAGGVRDPGKALRADLELTGGRSAYDREDVGLVEFAQVNGSILTRCCGCKQALPERRWRFYSYGTVVICLKCGRIYLGEAARAQEYQRKTAVR
jgi:hypothetical protein